MDEIIKRRLVNVILAASIGVGGMILCAAVYKAISPMPASEVVQAPAPIPVHPPAAQPPPAPIAAAPLVVAPQPVPAPPPELPAPPQVVVRPRAVPQPVMPEVPIDPRTALASVGKDPAAERIWLNAINDINTVPARDRKNLIEDLNETGFPDPQNLTPDDLPLINNRIVLIEQVYQNAADATNAAAFDEAYKDLLAMRAQLTGQ